MIRKKSWDKWLTLGLLLGILKFDNYSLNGLISPDRFDFPNSQDILSGDSAAFTQTSINNFGVGFPQKNFMSSEWRLWDAWHESFGTNSRNFASEVVAMLLEVCEPTVVRRRQPTVHIQTTDSVDRNLVNQHSEISKEDLALIDYLYSKDLDLGIGTVDFGTRIADRQCVSLSSDSAFSDVDLEDASTSSQFYSSNSTVFNESTIFLSPSNFPPTNDFERNVGNYDLSSVCTNADSALAETDDSAVDLPRSVHSLTNQSFGHDGWQAELASGENPQFHVFCNHTSEISSNCSNSDRWSPAELDNNITTFTNNDFDLETFLFPELLLSEEEVCCQDDVHSFEANSKTLKVVNFFGERKLTIKRDPDYCQYDYPTDTVPPQLAAERALQDHNYNGAASSRTKDESRTGLLEFTDSDIVSMNKDQFLQLTASRDISPEMFSHLKDIRRRGKNKISARLCRQRKLDVIGQLASQVRDIKITRKSLMTKKKTLASLQRQSSLRYQDLYQQLISRADGRSPIRQLINQFVKDDHTEEEDVSEMDEID